MIKGLSRIEWRVISVSLVLMMICAFLLANDRALQLLGFNKNSNEVVARIKSAAGDVRTKAENSGTWGKPRGELRFGDSVFVGEDGRADIELNSGARIEIAGNSIFRMIKMEGIPRLDMIVGKFVWRFSGPQAIAVKGVKSTLTGTDAAVEIAVDESGEEQKMKTLTGEAQLQVDRVENSPEDGRAPQILPAGDPRHFYVWRLEDFYNLKDQIIRPRPDPPGEVPLEVTLNWEHPSSGPFSLQVSKLADLTGERRHYSTVDPTYTLEKVFIGSNFWRVAFASQAWSEVATFFVEGRFLEALVEPEAKEIKVNLRNSSEVMLRWNFTTEMAAYIAEMSEDPKFQANQSRFRYLTAPEFVQEFSKPSVLHVRMRGVNARQELTDWSPVARVVVP